MTAGVLHLTLAFLGPVAPASAGPARQALRAAAGSAEPFPVRLGRLGRFPAGGPPTVLWLDVEAGGTELAEIAARVRTELASRDLPFDERPFRPHLTLARVQPRLTAADERCIAALGDARGTPLDFRADRLHLVESVRAPSGARYALVEEAIMGRGPGGGGLSGAMRPDA